MSFHLSKSALGVTQSLGLDGDGFFLNALYNGREILFHAFSDCGGEQALELLAVLEPLKLLVGALDNSIHDQVSFGGFNGGGERCHVDLVLAQEGNQCVLFLFTRDDSVSVSSSAFDSLSQLTLVFNTAVINSLE